MPLSKPEKVWNVNRSSVGRFSTQTTQKKNKKKHKDKLARQIEKAHITKHRFTLVCALIQTGDLARQ